MLQAVREEILHKDALLAALVPYSHFHEIYLQ